MKGIITTTTTPTRVFTSFGRETAGANSPKPRVRGALAALDTGSTARCCGPGHAAPAKRLDLF